MMTILETADFENGNATWKVYKKLHAENQNRELYIFHTNNEEIKVIKQPYIRST